MQLATAADGTRLAYDVVGDGPPLLLIAGQASDHTVWDRVVADFAAHHRVIVFDHRGTGDSDKPHAKGVDSPGSALAYSTRGFARDAIAVLDAAGIARAHVYGISMGGRIGQWLAVEHASRLGALVLGCTTLGNAHGVRRPHEADPALASGEPARMLPYLVSPAWLAAHPDVQSEMEAHQLAKPVPPHARRLHFLASEQHDVWDRLPSVTTPTLVIHGDADLINVAANAPLLAERIPGATLHMIPGGRHYYFWEYPAATAAVLDFVAAQNRPLTQR